MLVIGMKERTRKIIETSTVTKEDFNGNVCQFLKVVTEDKALLKGSIETRLWNVTEIDQLYAAAHSGEHVVRPVVEEEAPTASDDSENVEALDQDDAQATG